MADTQYPSESEMKAFFGKLTQFRDTLPDSEKRILDTMATAAFSPAKGEGDVQGYGWQPGPPVWVGGYTNQLVATPFGYQWQTVPTGSWAPGAPVWNPWLP